jgi:glycosyltransferase involved in cell wall biosynthesis
MNATEPLVSVIIATYNRADLVMQAIDSVRAQTYKAVEIIVADDASTDDTAQRLSDLPDVQVIVSPTQRGPGAARNSALAGARGTFVAPLDSDDVWEPDFLERSVAALVELDLDFVFSNWRPNPEGPSGLDTTLSRKPNILPRDAHDEWWVIEPAAVRRLYLEGNPSPHSSLVVRKASMPNAWSEEMLIGDDHYLVLEMVLGGADRVALTRVPRWIKRVDGHNRFDTLALRELLRRTISDRERLLRDFSGQLSLRERAYWRAVLWRIRLRSLRRLGIAAGAWWVPLENDEGRLTGQ